MSNKFRIPRKTKKKLTGMYFYPKDDKGNSMMAFPKICQIDYTALKQGNLVQWFKFSKAEQKQRRIEWDKKFNTPITISDGELLKAVNDIFAQEYREDAYKTFIRAKKHNVAIVDYYNFVNAWVLYKKGERTSNTACMSLDGAKDSLMRSKPRNSK